MFFKISHCSVHVVVWEECCLGRQQGVFNTGHNNDDHNGTNARLFYSCGLKFGRWVSHLDDPALTRRTRRIGQRRAHVTVELRHSLSGKVQRRRAELVDIWWRKEHTGNCSNRKRSITIIHLSWQCHHSHLLVLRA